MARYDMYDQATGNKTQVTPEERMMKNERKRAEALMRSYHRSPDSWTPSMVNTLKQLTAQYQIPFSPPEASAFKKLGVGSLGALDSVLFDLIPDSSYIDESTRQAAKYGKMAGLAGSFLIPGAGVAQAAKMARAGLGGGLAGKAAGGAIQHMTAPGLAAHIKGAASKIAGPAAKRAGMTGNWIDEGVAAANTVARRKGGLGVQEALKSGSHDDILSAIQASNMSPKQKANMARGAAKKLFGKTDNNVARTFMEAASGVKNVASGSTKKFIDHIQKHGININKLTDAQITKVLNGTWSKGKGKGSFPALKLKPGEKKELLESLKDHDDLSGFLRDYWKSLSSSADDIVEAGIDWSGAIPGALGGAALLHGQTIDIPEV